MAGDLPVGQQSKGHDCEVCEVATELAEERALHQETIAALQQAREDAGKLAATIAAFPDAHNAANLAHARMERDRLRAEVARVRADVAEDLAAIFSKRAEEERSQPGNWALANDWDVAAQVCEDYAARAAESVVGAPTPTAATGGQDCPNCRRYGAPARVEHCGPGCHEAHTYMPPCELAVRALPEDEGTRP